MTAEAESTLPLLSARKPRAQTGRHALRRYSIVRRGVSRKRQSDRGFYWQTRAGGKRLFSAIHRRQTDNHIVWLPLFEQTLNEVPVWCAVVRLKGRERASGAGDTLADGDANVSCQSRRLALIAACPLRRHGQNMPISFAASRQRSAIGV